MGALVRSDRSVSPGPDGEGVAVVGERRPLSPDPLAFVAFQPAAVQPVTALEVADPALGPGSVAPQPPGGALGSWLLAASDEHLLGRQVLERGVGRAGHEPSSATSRGEIPTRSSSATVPGSSVFSLGFPSVVDAGKIRPLAPGLVFSVTSASWLTYPNSFGLPNLPLRIGRASGSHSDTIRSVIGSPATRCLICRATFSHRSASSSSPAAASSFARAPRPRALR